MQGNEIKQNSFTFTYKNMKLVFRGIKNGYRHETICFYGNIIISEEKYK